MMPQDTHSPRSSSSSRNTCGKLAVNWRQHDMGWLAVKWRWLAVKWSLTENVTAMAQRLLSERQWEVNERQWKGSGRSMKDSERPMKGSGKAVERQWKGLVRRLTSGGGAAPGWVPPSDVGAAPRPHHPPRRSHSPLPPPRVLPATPARCC